MLKEFVTPSREMIASFPGDQSVELLNLAKRFNATRLDLNTDSGLIALGETLMQRGARRDVVEMIRIVGRDAFRSILDSVSRDVVSERYLQYWRARVDGSESEATASPTPR